MSRRPTPSRRRWTYALLIASVLLLTLMPLPAGIEPFRPYWVALLLVYWSLEAPRPVPLGLAFLIGLVLDVLTVSLMGQHALSLVIMLYLVGRFRSRIRFFSHWRQALAILALLLNDRVVLLWGLLLAGVRDFGWAYWVAPFVGALIWPWLFVLLDQAVRPLWRRRP